MRRDSAVRRLAAVAEDCQRVSGPQDGKAPVLTAAYAFTDPVDGAAELPVVQVAFVLNLPAEELTWCAEPGRHRVQRVQPGRPARPRRRCRGAHPLAAPAAKSPYVKPGARTLLARASTRRKKPPRRSVSPARRPVPGAVGERCLTGGLTYSTSRCRQLAAICAEAAIGRMSPCYAG